MNKLPDRNRQETDHWIVSIARHLPDPRVTDAIIVVSMIAAVVIAFLL